MSILLKCPNGHRREVGAQHAGKQVVCDECAWVWDVPAAKVPPVKRPSDPAAPAVTRISPRCPFCSHVGLPVTASVYPGGVRAVLIVAGSVAVAAVPVGIGAAFLFSGGRPADGIALGVAYGWLCPAAPIAALALLLTAIGGGGRVGSCKVCGVPWGSA